MVNIGKDELTMDNIGKQALLENMFYCIKLCSILTVYLVVALLHGIFMVYSLMLFNVQKKIILVY